MEQISKLPVYAGTIPNKATQSDDEFANNIFGFLNYSGNSFVRDFNVIVDEFNTLSNEIQTAEQSISNYAGQVKTARDEAVGALATLTAGAIDNTNKANNKAYSNIKVDELLDALDLSDISETTTLKHFTATLLGKLNSIAENANNYSHPSSHSANMITESATKRFVSDTEKNSWNSKAPLSSPSFTDNPTAPTQNPQDDSQKIATTAYVDGKFKIGIPVASTSGTAIDFIGIPSWAKKIKVLFKGVSTNGASPLLLQIGDQEGIETSGYESTAFGGVNGNVVSALLSTNGFICLPFQISTYKISGCIEISNLSGNIWVSSGNLSASGSNAAGWSSSGYKETLNILDRIRVISLNGTDTFDSGVINITYQG